MRRFLWLVVLLLITFSGHSQDYSSMADAVEGLYGGGIAEQLSGDEAERLEGLLDRPLKINIAGIREMVSSGLMSDYQAASLLDYRQNHGDVLSYSELAAVDGFNRGFVESIAPFVSLVSYSSPGYSSYERCDQELNMRSAVRSGEDLLFSSSMKYRLDMKDRFLLSAAVLKSYEDKHIAFTSGYMAVNLRRFAAEVTVGDFNARFGQGLSMWNGMVMNSLMSPSSYMKNPSGISRSWSFTGTTSLTGVAVSSALSRAEISFFVAVPGVKNIVKYAENPSILPALNISFHGKNHRVSVTNYVEFSKLRGNDPAIPDMKSAIEFACCLSGIDVFSEFAYDWVNAVPAGLAGIVFPVSSETKMAAHLRIYPDKFNPVYSGAIRSRSNCSDESGLSYSIEYKSNDYVPVNGVEGFGSSVSSDIVQFSADGMIRQYMASSHEPVPSQIRVQMIWKHMLSPAFRIDVRLNARYRNWEEYRLKCGLRTDLNYYSDLIVASFRMEVQRFHDISFLTYVEGGYKSSRMNLFLRTGLFSVDNWEDRIYAYERDAPGNFSVPAYYGRGWWTSLTSSWKFRHAGKLYFRASCLAYPFMEKKKPGRAELKLQYIISF